MLLVGFCYARTKNTIIEELVAWNQQLSQKVIFILFTYIYIYTVYVVQQNGVIGETIYTHRGCTRCLALSIYIVYVYISYTCIYIYIYILYVYMCVCLVEDV